jgi:hypothetical protein
VAAFQDLRIEHLSRSIWTIRNQKLFERHHSRIKRVSFRDSLFRVDYERLPSLPSAGSGSLRRGSIRSRLRSGGRRALRESTFDLVSQHQELDIPSEVAPCRRGHGAEQTAESDVDDREQQRAPPRSRTESGMLARNCLSQGGCQGY